MRRIFIILNLVILAVATSADAYLIRGPERDVEALDVRIDGKKYLLLTDFCEAYGIQWEWDSFSGRITLRRGDNEIILLIGSRCYYDGKSVKKIKLPVRMENGSACVPLSFVKYTAPRLFGIHKKRPSGKKQYAVATPITPAKKQKRPFSYDKRFRISKIVIDPGHGGKDPGAIGRTGLYEKDVVLDISGMVKEELEKNGIHVIMTRETDVFIPLERRTAIANESDADLFISIHANANRRRWIRGFEIYYLSEATDDNARALAASENSVLKYEDESLAGHSKHLDAILWDLTFTEYREESIELAEFICRGVSKCVALNHGGIKSARFYVLKGAEMPAVLIELSYLTNRRDERNLKKESYKRKLAEGIVKGILNYKREFERTKGFSL